MASCLAPSRNRVETLRGCIAVVAGDVSGHSVQLARSAKLDACTDIAPPGRDILVLESCRVRPGVAARSKADSPPLEYRHAHTWCPGNGAPGSVKSGRATSCRLDVVDEFAGSNVWPSRYPVQSSG